mgnify:CR=1 FL=1
MSEPANLQSNPKAQRGPRYAAIEDELARSIRAKRLPPGLVLTEEPFARLFGTSRTPVRKAFNKLERDGLLERFEGRGFLVAGAEEPRRETITHEMLGLSYTPPTDRPLVAADRIDRAFEASLAQALPFGQYRVYEQAAADYFQVSRTIIRELLSRFQDRGLVRKDMRSHWVVGPLTASDIKHYFAIRSRLEPLALIDSAPLFTPGEINEFLDCINAALDHNTRLDPEHIEDLETALHVTLLSRTPNPHLLRMIRQSQIALSVNQVFAETVGSRPFATSLSEHRIIMEFLLRGSIDMAASALQEHLHLSAARTRERLMSFSVFPEPVMAPYLRSF